MISSLVNRNVYPGTGSVGPFPFTFRIISAADLQVIRRSATDVETILAAGPDFLVAGVGDAAGSITLAVALAVGEILSIRRAPALLQPTSLVNGAAYYASIHEAEFDRLVMQVQALDDAIRRAVRVPDSFDPTAMSMTPRPVAGRALVWQSSTQIDSAILDAGAVALPADGRTVASQSTYLAHNAVFNIMDYGAIGDGVADDTAAIQACLTRAMASSFGGRVLVPRGRFNYTTLSLAGARNVIVEGMGTGAPSSAGDCALVCTAAGAGVGISLASAQGILFRDLGLYDTAALTGKLVATGHSALGRDPSHLRFVNCRFSSAGVQLDLELSIIVTVEQCAFRGGTRAISGHNGTYSNVVAIRDCEFSSCANAPIFGPGETWTIESCAFEPLSDGTAGAVECQAGIFFQYGFNYRGNWHGDGTVTGNPWLRVRPLGGVIQGNFVQLRAGETFILLKGSSTGTMVQGNRVTQGGAGAIGLDFEATVTKPVVIGNDFQCDVPIRNQQNVLGGFFQENTNTDGSRALDLNSTTPNVGGGSQFTSVNTLATAITYFNGGIDGQKIEVWFTDTHTTLVNSADLKLLGGANFIAGVNDRITLRRQGAVWYEVARTAAVQSGTSFVSKAGVTGATVNGVSMDLFTADGGWPVAWIVIVRAVGVADCSTWLWVHNGAGLIGTVLKDSGTITQTLKGDNLTVQGKQTEGGVYPLSWSAIRIGS